MAPVFLEQFMFTQEQNREMVTDVRWKDANCNAGTIRVRDELIDKSG